MSLGRSWDPPALAYLMSLHPSRAARLDAAVIRYAETGEGDVVRGGPRDVLRVGPYDVEIVTTAETVNVLRIHRARK